MKYKGKKVGLIQEGLLEVGDVLVIETGVSP